MRIAVEYKQTSTKDGLYAYALHVSASSPEGYDSHVFVYQRQPPRMDPFGKFGGVRDDVFVNVATPVDMADIPCDQPDIEHGMPYYRSSTVDLWFRNLEDTERAKREIDRDIGDLVRLMNQFDKPDEFPHTETREYE